MDVRARPAAIHGAMVRFVRAFPLTAFLFSLGAASPLSACVGDCNEDGVVSIDELILCADIALRSRSVELCPPGDANEDQRIGIDELVQAVDNTLNACPMPSMIPTSGPELLAWLQAGNYLDWTSESALHPPVGPHFQLVLTYFNEPLLASLAAGDASHPAGSAAVKELYNNGGELAGWAAMVKTQDDSDGGMSWFWYEGFGDSISFSGFGLGVCTSCHDSEYRGLPSKDFVLSPYPLQ
jgi:hypothetical protein